MAKPLDGPYLGVFQQGQNPIFLMLQTPVNNSRRWRGGGDCYFNARQKGEMAPMTKKYEHYQFNASSGGLYIRNIQSSSGGLNTTSKAT